MDLDSAALTRSFGELPPAAAGRGPRLGPYEVIGRLGRGGCGTVYRVRDGLGRELALKQMHDGAGFEALERFRREGELLARLDHPGIVRVFAGGLLAGKPFLLCELIEGPVDCAALLAHPRLERRLRLLVDIARAVGYAHAQGIVHRDLKPGNVLIDAQGTPHVADFGLALAADQERLTRTGQLAGTPRLMAPEQVAGARDRIAPPTDVWALGVMLYLALTGRYPFLGDSLATLAIQIVAACPQPPRQLVSEVPGAVEEVCLRALSREPEDRYPDANAFAEALSRALAGQPSVRRRTSRRTLVAVMLTAAAVGLALVALAFGLGLSALRGRALDARAGALLDPAGPLARWDLVGGAPFPPEAVQLLADAEGRDTPELGELRAVAQAAGRLARARAGEEVSLAPRSAPPVARVVDALVLGGRGHYAEALRRVRAAAAEGTDAGWAEDAAEHLLREAFGQAFADPGEQTLHRLVRGTERVVAAAEGFAPERVAAAKVAALEACAADWRAALRRRPGDAALRETLDRLCALFLEAAPPARPGPRIQDELLDPLFSRAQAELARGRLDAPRVRAFVRQCLRADYELGVAPPESAEFDALVHTALGAAPPYDPALIVYCARLGVGRKDPEPGNLIRKVDLAETERLVARWPRSRGLAVCFLQARQADPRQGLGAVQVGEEAEALLGATDPELHRHYGHLPYVHAASGRTLRGAALPLGDPAGMAHGREAERLARAGLALGADDGAWHPEVLRRLLEVEATAADLADGARGRTERLLQAMSARLLARVEALRGDPHWSRSAIIAWVRAEANRAQSALDDGAFERAEALAQKALETFPACPDHELLWYVRSLVARAYLARGDLAGARLAFPRDPVTLGMFYGVPEFAIRLLLAEGDEEAAREALRVALRARPRDPPLKVLARELGVRQRR